MSGAATPPAPMLPYGRQSIDEDDIAAVAEVLRGDWLTTGPMVRRFEEAFAARVGAAHAVACNSGTAALHLATLALGLQPGDVAIVPSVTFLATANAVRYVGADVVFADVDSATGLLTPNTLLAAIARAPVGAAKAVLPVHLKGLTADPAGIAAVAAAHGLTVIEDACHALGTEYQAAGDWHSVGACRHDAITAFSFHPVKTIAMGEGGIATTNDPALYRAMLRFRSHGMEADPAQWQNDDLAREENEPAPWYYEMPSPGFNYRAPDFACALGLSQMRKLDYFIARRAELVALYDKSLAPLAPLVLSPQRPADCRPGWHIYAVQIDFAALGRQRGQVMRALRAMGVGSQVHYIPVHLQPYYRQLYGPLSLPGAEHYYSQTLSLPLYPDMRDEDVARVVQALAEVLALRC